MIRKLLALTLCLCAPSLCSADVIVQFGQGGVVSASQNFSANAGGQLTLDIFMTQQGFDPNFPPNSIADYRLSAGAPTRGLGSYYLEMAVRNAGQALAQTGVRASLSSFNFQSGFDGRSGETTFLDAPNGNLSATPTSTLRLVGIAADDPADGGAQVLPRTVTAPFQFLVGTPNNNTVADNSIRLGTITFNIANDAAGAYQVGFSAPGGPQRSNLGNDISTGYFDINNFGNSVATITVVPEPATVALFTICAGGLGFTRFRRKAAKKAE